MHDGLARRSDRWTLVRAGVLLATAALGGSAWAEAPAPTPPVANAASGPASSPRDEARWSVAGGVMFVGEATPFVIAGWSSTLSPPAATVPLGFTVERRVAEGTWLTARLALSTSSDFSVGNSGSVVAITPFSSFTTSGWRGGLSVGCRQAFNPGALVEVGAYADLGAARAVSKSVHDFEPDPTTGLAPRKTTTTSGANSVVGALGLTAEHFFTPGLSLRLSLQVARVTQSWASSNTSVEGLDPPPNQTAQSFNAGLAFSPAFDLRFLF